MTDPIEQAWARFMRGATWKGRTAQELRESRMGVSQAILRYHPDVVRLVKALRKVKATLTSEGVRVQAFDITDDVAVGGMYQAVTAALVPFTTEEVPE